MSRLLSDAEIDKLHADIRDRYPDGLNYEQFKRVTLESADEDGRVYPPELTGFGTFQMILKMSLDGLLQYRGTHQTPYLPNHFITDLGRSALAQSEDARKKGE